VKNKLLNRRQYLRTVKELTEVFAIKSSGKKNGRFLKIGELS
jgi:hypothetical protein